MNLDKNFYIKNRYRRGGETWMTQTCAYAFRKNELITDRRFI